MSETETAGAESPDASSAEEITGWKGHRLDDLSGGAIGKVEGTFVDDSTGRPEWLLARMGRFGHYCLVPARDAVGANGHVWVPYSREQIRKAPRVDPRKPIERDAEQSLLDYYGIGTSTAGRGAELAERESGVTLRPGA